MLLIFTSASRIVFNLSPQYDARHLRGRQSSQRLRVFGSRQKNPSVSPARNASQREAGGSGCSSDPVPNGERA